MTWQDYDKRNVSPAMSRGLSSAWPMLLLAAVFALALIALLIPGSSHSMLDSNFRNSLHAPGFGLLAGATLMVFRRRFAALRAYVFAATLCVGVGLLSEALQFLGPRDSGLMDFVNNLVGTGGVLILAASVDRHLIASGKRPLRSVLLLVGAALAIAGLQPAAWFSYAILQRNAAAPQILSFEQRWEQEIYQPYGGARLLIADKPPGWPGSGRKVGRLFRGSSKFSGIEIEAFADWRGYKTLSFTVDGAPARTEVWSIRIEDSTHDGRYDDRYNLEFETGAGPRKISISLASVRSAPAGRAMDMQAISKLILFYRGSNLSAELTLDGFKLE